MNTALSYAMMLLDLLPKLVDAGISITSIAAKGRAAMQSMVDEDRNPTEEEWAEVTKLRDELHQKVQDA